MQCGHRRQVASVSCYMLPDGGCCCCCPRQAGTPTRQHHDCKSSSQKVQDIIGSCAANRTDLGKDEELRLEEEEDGLAWPGFEMRFTLGGNHQYFCTSIQFSSST